MTQEHLITAIAAWWLVVALKSFIHKEIIVTHKIDPHKNGRVKVLNWILTGMASIVHALTFDLQDMKYYFVVLFFQVMWHKVIFAPLLNKLRQKTYFYLGLESGGFDKYFVFR